MTSYIGFVHFPRTEKDNSHASKASKMNYRKFHFISIGFKQIMTAKHNFFNPFDVRFLYHSPTLIALSFYFYVLIGIDHINYTNGTTHDYQESTFIRNYRGQFVWIGPAPPPTSHIADLVAHKFKINKKKLSLPDLFWILYILLYYGVEKHFNNFNIHTKFYASFQ